MRSAGVALGACLLMLLSRVHGAQAADCAELESCASCITGNALLNLTDCMWAHCQSEILCVAKGSDNLTDCTIYNESSQCDEPATTTEIPTTAPVYSPSSFDPASFIGGMVLVLGAEAALFFAIKFFKARDATYQTLSEETQ
ncbi:CD164 sialomucin-like 2 protein isoform X5 [Narcine bancroftii]|uniref:CD164 sialomucin-like 2 protein isoform X5 n=1 Tax=Narcine bancroftii TaxID=1343680 RepID=UPI003831BD38